MPEEKNTIEENKEDLARILTTEQGKPLAEARGEIGACSNTTAWMAEEARRIESGEYDRENNPLVNAPHTADDVMKDWDRPYDRERAIYPTVDQREDKYWPPVNRIDQVYGDRHLVCSCPPLDAYLDAAE